jgi:HPt (histidine-containing phosphotransfer) domain-containing protein/CheY-like chemotaxis protein
LFPKTLQGWLALVKPSRWRQQKPLPSEAAQASVALPSQAPLTHSEPPPQDASWIEVPAAFELRTTCEQAMTLLAPAAQDKGVELLLLLYADVPRWLHGEQARLRHLLIKLLGDAIDLTGRRQLVVRVMLADEGEGHSRMEIALAEAGAPIPTAAQPPPPQPRGGSDPTRGDIRRLVEKMGGDMEAAGALADGEADGTLLRVRLPLPEPLPTAPPESLPVGPHCLVLEADRLARVAIGHLLRELGCTWSDSPSSPPQLVLVGLPTDQRTPEQAIPRLREIRQRWPQPPVLALINDSDRQRLARIEAASGVRCLAKPVPRQVLRQALESLARESPGQHAPQPTPQPGAGGASAPHGGPSPGSSTAAPLTPPMRDVAKALSVAGGHEDLAERLLHQFLDELPQHLGDIRTASQRADWAMLGQHLHKLRGAATYCGALALAAASESIEQRLRQGALPPPPLVEALFGEATRLLRHYRPE